MRNRRAATAAMVTAAVLGLGMAGTEREEAGRLTSPTGVVLDFQGRPIPEVVEAIALRSGKRVVAQNAPGVRAIGTFPSLGDLGDAGWRKRAVTLESPAPVPFWEAIDRLAEAGGLAYRLGDFGDTGAATIGVVFEGDGEAPGPACYAGPFRVGLLGIHERREAILVRGPWVRFSPSGFASPVDAADLATFPDDGGPRYVELSIAVEPGLVCRRDGPLTGLVAEDEAGRSLLVPPLEDARRSIQAFSGLDGGFAPIIRIPLGRAEGLGASREIARLRGAIPVEVAVLRAEPAVVIPLGDAEGETFRGGGAAFTVEEDRTGPDGRRSIRVTCRLTGDEAPELREARLTLLRTYQIRMVDSRGETNHFSPGSGGDGMGSLYFSYEYAPGGVASEPPAEFRYYDLDRESWQVPFEFRDVPLP